MTAVDLVGGVATRLAKIRAIARRDWIVERSYHFRLAFRLVTVLFSIATYFFLSELIGDADELRRYDGGYFTFVLIGLLMTTSAFLGLRTFSSNITSEMGAGTLEVLLSTPTRLSTILFGSFLVPFALGMIEMLILLGVAVAFFGVRLDPGGILLAVPIFGLALAVFSAVGVASASFIVLTKRGEPFTLFVSQATNLLAGVMFPVALLPGMLEAIAHAIPAFYALNALRSVLLADAGLMDVVDEIAILAGFVVLLLPPATWFFRRAVRSAQVTGTLANY